MQADEPMHQELWCKIDAALSEESHESANEAFATAERLASQLLASNPNDADVCYAIALTWYHRWLPKNERRTCLQWLEKADELDPQHPWVPLYLGYQHFDDEQYSDAIAAFSRVNHDYFASIDHHWRNLKTRELMICCRVRIGSSDAELGTLSQLVSDYKTSEIFDRPVPSEIVGNLVDPTYLGRFDAASTAVAREMCRLIEGIGDQRIFAEELGQFKTAAEA